jgi:hypothetical protein
MHKEIYTVYVKMQWQLHQVAFAFWIEIIISSVIFDEGEEVACGVIPSANLIWQDRINVSPHVHGGGGIVVVVVVVVVFVVVAQVLVPVS